jgi:hypothetical protein
MRLVGAPERSPLKVSIAQIMARNSSCTTRRGRVPPRQRNLDWPKINTTTASMHSVAAEVSDVKIESGRIIGGGPGSGRSRTEAAGKSCGQVKSSY